MPSTTQDSPLPLTPSGKDACILLRSSWQTVNIGDIGHSPGVLSLLEKHLPQARVILWAQNIDRGVREMLLRRFPQMEIVQGRIGGSGEDASEPLERAVAEADLLLHGSGPSIVARDDVIAWKRATGKPYGLYGITIDPLMKSGEPDDGDLIERQREAVMALPADDLSPEDREVLDGARFVFCRDTLTLDYLRKQGVTPGQLAFAPDGAFGCDLRDDASADAFMGAHGLEAGRFISVIPRLRYTPYHEIHNTPQTPVTKRRAEISARHIDADMSKLAEVVTRWIDHTGLPVLLCPEMTYQVELGRLLRDEYLSERVRERVVWRPDYWLPDEACSTFARSCAVLSMDNHSPIFALAAGIPTIFMRQPTDTIKGQMWRDIGMDEWFFEIDACPADAISAALLRMADRPDEAHAQVTKIMERVHAWQHDTMALVGTELNAAQPTSR